MNFFASWIKPSMSKNWFMTESAKKICKSSRSCVSWDGWPSRQPSNCGECLLAWFADSKIVFQRSPSMSKKAVTQSANFTDSVTALMCASIPAFCEWRYRDAVCAERCAISPRTTPRAKEREKITPSKNIDIRLDFAVHRFSHRPNSCFDPSSNGKCPEDAVFCKRCTANFSIDWHTQKSQKTTDP